MESDRRDEQGLHRNAGDCTPAAMLAELELAQQRYFAQVSELVGECCSQGLVGQTMSVHLGLTARFFAAQRAILSTVTEVEHEVAAVQSTSVAIDAEESAKRDWLQEVFPDLADSSRATRLRLEALADDLGSDDSLLAEMASVLAEESKTSVNGRAEHDAMTTFLDDLWCATHSMRRAVVDDAHARDVLVRRMTERAVVAPVEADEVSAVAEVPQSQFLVAVADTLRQAEPTRLREILRSLVQTLPPVEVAPMELEPVSDEPLFSLGTSEWSNPSVVLIASDPERSFWPVEESAPRIRRRPRSVGRAALVQVAS